MATVWAKIRYPNVHRFRPGFIQESDNKLSKSGIKEKNRALKALRKSPRLDRWKMNTVQYMSPYMMYLLQSLVISIDNGNKMRNRLIVTSPVKYNTYNLVTRI